MIIFATFANRRSDEPGAFELVDAWDEYAVDVNPEGFEESRAAALASLGDDLLRHVTVRIAVPTREIVAALEPDIEVVGTFLGTSAR